MDELCPLCLKMGSNKRIKAVQINMDEAVWMCENEECPWPFGYETPNFLFRKVGVNWSNEWEMYRKVQKRIGPIPVSTELSLYTPPVTPSSDTVTKESNKTNYSGTTNISDQIDRVGKIFGCLDDSYAPKSSFENRTETKLLDTIVISEIADSGVPSRKAPAMQSIFDINIAESPARETLKSQSSDKRETDVSIISRRVLDIKNTSEPTETVLERSKETEPLSESNVEGNKKDILSVEQEDETKKVMPQIKSISVANVDLQLVDRGRAVKDEPKDFHKSIDVGSLGPSSNQADLPKVNKSDSPVKSDIVLRRDSELPVNEESVVSRKHQNPSSRQHKTITVDGSLPVILSYDLTDLEGKSNEIVSNMPIRESTREVSLAQRENVKDNVNEAELPKKRIRPAATRRGLLVGKQYEKFSFSALKKLVPASRESVDKSGSTFVAENTCQSVKLEETSIKAENSLMLDTRINPANIEIPDSVNQQIGSLNSVITDPIVETLNLSSVLDDILIDGYQNATENLNDDWLESFFT